MSFLKSLTFAWWNTGLAPSARSRSSSEERDLACRVIAALITEAGADFIAMGEMSEFDLDNMTAVFKDFDFEVLSGVNKAGRSKFDLCYAYNRRKLSVCPPIDILDARGNSKLKIAQKLTMQSLVSGTVMSVFVSHWPSRMHTEDQDRSVYGLRLRDQALEAVNESADGYVVMMGDFNDEPFDRSLNHHLMASRDIDFVRKNKHLFYNLFWQQFGKKTPELNAAGSYFYNGGKVTKWLTFDQIILSQAFIAKNEWSLVDIDSFVFETPELLDLVVRSGNNFDHLPVYCRVEQVD